MSARTVIAELTRFNNPVRMSNGYDEQFAEDAFRGSFVGLSVYARGSRIGAVQEARHRTNADGSSGIEITAVLDLDDQDTELLQMIPHHKLVLGFIILAAEVDEEANLLTITEAEAVEIQVPLPDRHDRVYMLTSGEYSDYRIHSIWTTREAAEAELHKLPRSHYDSYESEDEHVWGTYQDIARVEERVLNHKELKPVLLWQAHLGHGGKVVVSESPEELQEVPAPKVWGAKDELGEAWGYSPEHARKVLSDFVAQVKARHAGLTL